MKVEQGKQTAYVTAALKADYSRMRGPKSGSESGRTELKAKILTLGIAVVVTLHISSFVSFLSLQLTGLINHIECR